MLGVTAGVMVALVRFASRQFVVSGGFVAVGLGFGDMGWVVANGEYFAVIEDSTGMGVPWDWCRVIWSASAFKTLITFTWCVRFRLAMSRFPVTTLVLLNYVAPVARSAHILSMNE